MSAYASLAQHGMHKTRAVVAELVLFGPDAQPCDPRLRRLLGGVAIDIQVGAGERQGGGRYARTGIKCLPSRGDV